GQAEVVIVGGDGLVEFFQPGAAFGEQLPDRGGGLIGFFGVGDGGEKVLGVLVFFVLGEFASDVFEDLRGDGGAFGRAALFGFFRVVGRFAGGVLQVATRFGGESGDVFEMVVRDDD